MKAESGLITKVISKIDEIPPQEWLKCFPDVLENYNFFKSLDESYFENFTFLYILVFNNENLVGAAPCFITRFPFDCTVQGPLKNFLEYLKLLLPDILNPKVLICGLPMGQGRIGIIGDSGPILEAICNRMEKVAEENKVSVLMFKDFTRAYEDMLNPLLEGGFCKVESLPSTDMRIDFTSFDEYLKTLSRVSKDGLKRKFKKVDAQIKFDLEVTSTLEDKALSEIYGLYLQTLNKMDLGFEKVPMDFFKTISLNMPDEVKYFLWRIEGKIVAFAFCLVSKEHFIDYYLGFDYSVAHKYNLYSIRFRDLIKWCIAHGLKTYEMGVTSYEPKRRLGFDFLRLYFYIKHRNKLVNPLVKMIGCLIGPKNFDPVFKIMKKIKGGDNE